MSKQENSKLVAAVRSLSIRRLRPFEAQFPEPHTQAVKIDGRPLLVWVLDQADQARKDNDTKRRATALNTLSWLLSKGMSVATIDHGNTPLMEASIHGDVACARRLLHAGAQINQRSTLGNTALHWAAFAGRPRMCKVLIENGAQLDIANQQGQTPLHCATDKLRMNTVLVLHEAGAAWDKKDVHSRTPLEVLAHRDAAQAAAWRNRPERDGLAQTTPPVARKTPSSRL